MLLQVLNLILFFGAWAVANLAGGHSNLTTKSVDSQIGSINYPAAHEIVQSDSVYTIKWDPRSPNDGIITVSLWGAPENTLAQVIGSKYRLALLCPGSSKPD